MYKLKCALKCVVLMLISYSYANKKDDLRDTMIVILFKKGDEFNCGNYRGIASLSTMGKIITRTLLNHLPSTC